MYTQNEVMEFIKEEDVKFIKLAFCDLFGKQRNISITDKEISLAFDKGIVIDATNIKGFSDKERLDLLLHPDPSTLSILPWRPEHGRVVRMFCDISHMDGIPFECDNRMILKKAIDKAERHGISFSFAPKMEFYLFKLDANGNKSNETYDKAGYMDVAPEDKGENIRREICLTLEQMGIEPKSSHHEKGPGQNKINLGLANPMTAADNIITFRQVASTVANRNGLYADLSPKPIKGAEANSFHFSLSVKTKDNKDYIKQSVAGVLNRINDLSAFFNKDAEINSADLKLTNSIANPYTTFASIIDSAILGINNNEELKGK